MAPRQTRGVTNQFVCVRQDEEIFHSIQVKSGTKNAIFQTELLVKPTNGQITPITKASQSVLTVIQGFSYEKIFLPPPSSRYNITCTTLTKAFYFQWIRGHAEVTGNKIINR